MGKRRSFMPTWVRTVHDMRKGNVLVRWSCRVCDNFGDVDLERIETVKGADFSLVNKRPRCKQPGCSGHVLFLYSPGKSTPMRPLLWDDDEL